MRGSEEGTLRDGRPRRRGRRRVAAVDWTDPLDGALSLPDPAGTGPPAYRAFRQELGRSLLLTLEFLIAADIIYTIAVNPTFTSLGMLGLLVLIRTFLSFSLEMIGIPFCGSAHRDPKNPAGDHIPASVWEPKTASMRSRLAKEPHFDQTVFDNSLLCQS